MFKQERWNQENNPDEECPEAKTMKSTGVLKDTRSINLPSMFAPNRRSDEPEDEEPKPVPKPKKKVQRKETEETTKIFLQIPPDLKDEEPEVVEPSGSADKTITVNAEMMRLISYIMKRMTHRGMYVDPDRVKYDVKPKQIDNFLNLSPKDLIKL